MCSESHKIQQYERKQRNAKYNRKCLFHLSWTDSMKYDQTGNVRKKQDVHTRTTKTGYLLNKLKLLTERYNISSGVTLHPGGCNASTICPCSCISAVWCLWQCVQ